ncbi:hypothetical protein WA026_017611 [Henosepilachna vigintioctopunctata]|uniref:Uncharacterized protein n=1 Tax=Henosepilachna vigintioctopunctata TaxID=420089 RepID=A0AAW1UT92_9CUCU
MDWDILKKEREYHEENELLESKTKALLQKADDAMKMQDNILKDSHTKVDALFKKPVFGQSIKHGSDAVLQSNFTEIILDDPALPNTDILNDMGQKAIHQFYRAKIKSLQEECDKLQVVVRNKNLETKQLQRDLGQNTEDKEKWFLQYNLGKTQISKMDNQISLLSIKLQSRDTENNVMKKEIENLKKEIRVISQNIISNELKLNKALEENEKIKILLRNSRKEEKDLKENHKKQLQELTSALHQTEKHKNELINGFKKQLQLIDNLKKQKVNLQIFNIAQVAEAEFMKILDWKDEP